MDIRSTRKAMIFILLATLFCTISCDNNTKGRASKTETSTMVRLYGTDGNMNNSFGESLKEHPGILSNMRGTTPAPQLTPDFKGRLLALNQNLTSFAYTGEAYDAVAIAAIAAEYAHSTDPVVIAKNIIGVTTSGTVCESISSCLHLARQGKDLQYRGIALRYSGLTDTGEPAYATFGAVKFNRDNAIDESVVEYIRAGDEQGHSKSPSPLSGRNTRASGPLRIGSLLPHTGRLASFGPALVTAVQLAIKEVNMAGGILNTNVVLFDHDDGSSTSTALSAVKQLISQNTHIIIGAGASGITKAIIPKIIEAGRILISPTSTSDELSTIDDNNLFFRTAPPDSLQAKALTDVIVRDGPSRIAIVAIDDVYGSGLAEGLQSNLLLAGIKTKNIRRTKYPAKDSYNTQDMSEIFSPISLDIKAFRPDAIVIIGSDESSYFIQTLHANKVIKTV